MLSMLSFPSRSAPAGLGPRGDRGAHAQDCAVLCTGAGLAALVRAPQGFLFGMTDSCMCLWRMLFMHFRFIIV